MRGVHVVRPMRGVHALSRPMKGVHEKAHCGLSLPFLHSCSIIQITPLFLLGILSRRLGTLVDRIQ
jgi:hypothetical protein